MQLPHLAGIERLEDESAHGVDVTGRAGDDAHDSWFDPNRSSGQDPADIVLSALPDQAVTTALAALPVHYRTAVVLADVDGYPYKEIARITQVPIGTVMSRLSRGRKALRDALRYT
ncbi:MAG TPA: sigma factor-like helix-turn-helix DNA-binding protein [Pseudonocardiaceae bacterium]